KKQIANLTKELSALYQFQSIGEYKTLLSLYNIGLEEVKGEFNGKPYHGIVYFALDKKGRKKGQPVKASLIGKQVGAENLLKRCNFNTQNIKKYRLTETSKPIIEAALATSKTKKQFVRQLHKQGIDTVFRENRDGRIYGVTFIDHHRHTALNGSRYGKAFSANVLNEKFGQNNTPKASDESEKNKTIAKDSANTALIPFIDFTCSGENYEEEAFIRRMKRKRKRKL
ncbi:MAG: relaxase, partial [Draconibacterium sp.]